MDRAGCFSDKLPSSPGSPEMTPTIIAADAVRSSDFRTIALVCAAHFVSHIYILILAPLFVFVRADFGVSYTELGVAIAIFNVLSALLQTPAGLLVDRTSARAVLVAGLLLGAASLAGAAAASSFALFVAMFALCGVANAAYHPADYALLSSRVSAARMSHAYSIHIFAGFAGTAAAPVTLLALAEYGGWRCAFLTSAVLGIAVAAAILLLGGNLAGRDPSRKTAKNGNEKTTTKTDWSMLLSAPVLLNLLFYILLAMTGAGIANYGIVALQALWNTPLPLATGALTVYLAMSAFAVLAGGYVSARTDRHDLVATVGLAVNALTLVPLALFDLGAAMLIGLMSLSGFFNGVLQPSRDMIVRSVTPHGAFGTVFGFVTTGFNIGGIIAPPVFGYLMDQNAPHLVILGAALCALLSVPTVMTIARGKPPSI